MGKPKFHTGQKLITVVNDKTLHVFFQRSVGDKASVICCDTREQHNVPLKSLKLPAPARFASK